MEYYFHLLLGVMTSKNQTREYTMDNLPITKFPIRYAGENNVDPTWEPRTFFQTADEWPMYDNADPLHGWSSKDIEDTPSGASKADIYGKLFYNLHETLGNFLSHLSRLEISFRLFQMNAIDLVNHVENNSFSRIEVSTWGLSIPYKYLYKSARGMKC